MRRLLCWCAGGPLGLQPARAFVVVMLACMTVAACGGDEGSDQTERAEEQGAAGTLDAGDDGGGPPTAGPGEAGLLEGPGGDGPAVRIPDCGDIDVPDLLADEQYELLIAKTDCIFENRDHMPPEALEIAREAQGMAQRALDEEGEETTDTGEEVEPEAETEPEPKPEDEPEAEADG